jgi:hypothetical protein
MKTTCEPESLHGHSTSKKAFRAEQYNTMDIYWALNRWWTSLSQQEKRTGVVSISYKQTTFNTRRLLVRLNIRTVYVSTKTNAPYLRQMKDNLGLRVWSIACIPICACSAKDHTTERCINMCGTYYYTDHINGQWKNRASNKPQEHHMLVRVTGNTNQFVKDEATEMWLNPNCTNKETTHPPKPIMVGSHKYDKIMHCHQETSQWTTSTQYAQ